MNFFRTLLFLVVVTGFQCKKTGTDENVYTGRLIVNGSCKHYAVQLLKGTIDTANLVSSWYDPDNDSTYANAFAVGNYCGFGSAGLQAGDTFTFRIDPHPIAQTCPICAPAVQIPSKSIAIIDVQKIK